MNESSDTGEAGFNEMRVQFPGYGAIGEGGHDLIAILHYFYRLVAIDRGIVALMRSCFLYLYLGLGSRVWLQYYIILNSVLEILCVLCVWIDVTWSSWRVVLEEKSWSALGRRLGSGTVHIAGTVKIWFVRLAWLVSHNRRPEAFWGFRFNNLSDRPLLYTMYV